MTGSEIQKNMQALYSILQETSNQIDEASKKLDGAREKAQKAAEGLKDSEDAYKFLKSQSCVNLMTFKASKDRVKEAKAEDQAAKWYLMDCEALVKHREGTRDTLKAKYSELETELQKACNNVRQYVAK